jgi:Double zinc ribbon
MAGLASYALGMPICAQCGEDNPARARFCLACGSPLAASGTGREVRKTVTVVFSDLVGSTPLGERLDPESRPGGDHPVLRPRRRGARPSWRHRRQVHRGRRDGGVRHPSAARGRLFEALARGRPLIVVVDDLHWADPALLDLLEHVARFASDAPILIVGTARPELLDDRPEWGSRSTEVEVMMLALPVARDPLLDAVDLHGAHDLRHTYATSSTTGPRGSLRDVPEAMQHPLQKLHRRKVIVGDGGPRPVQHHHALEGHVADDHAGHAQ